MGHRFVVKLIKPIPFNRMLGLPHQRGKVSQVVKRHQRWPNHFIDQKKMPEVSPRKILAGVTLALGIERLSIFETEVTKRGGLPPFSGPPICLLPQAIASVSSIAS
mgnify:CR=1 FL=1